MALVRKEQPPRVGEGGFAEGQRVPFTNLPFVP